MYDISFIWEARFVQDNNYSYSLFDQILGVAFVKFARSLLKIF